MSLGRQSGKQFSVQGRANRSVCEVRILSLLVDRAVLTVPCPRTCKSVCQRDQRLESFGGQSGKQFSVQGRADRSACEVRISSPLVNRAVLTVACPRTPWCRSEFIAEHLVLIASYALLACLIDLWHFYRALCLVLRDPEHETPPPPPSCSTS